MQTKNSLKLAAAVIAVAIGAQLAAQQSPQIDFKSVGRGAPVMVDAATLPQTGALWQGGRGGPGAGPATNQPRTFVGGALPGETPKGIKPLPRDMFTSDDFYKDKDLWADKRYWRCTSTGRCSRACACSWPSVRSCCSAPPAGAWA